MLDRSRSGAAIDADATECARVFPWRTARRSAVDIDGKKRVFMAYAGGFGSYRGYLDNVAAQGYSAAWGSRVLGASSVSTGSERPRRLGVTSASPRRSREHAIPRVNIC